MADPIATLRALLTLDSAAFERGMKRAQKSASQLERRMNKASRNLRRAGAALTVGLTGPLAGLAAVTSRAQGALTELGNQARIAGVAATEFKTLSIAAGQFGIGQDKLSDILKDVNDKFGDFAATGAGPLADFFENIAPQVGVTQKSFEGLSSSDALALYVSSLEKANVSQAEMTFYMEALASDATALIPLYEGNAAALDQVRKKADELGLALDEGTISAATAARQEFTLVSEVLRTNMQAALIELVPVFSNLAAAAIPVIQGISRTVRRMGEAFAALAPETQGFVIAGGAIAAALGPALIALGLMASGASTLIGIVSALTLSLRGLALTTGFGALIVGAGVLVDWMLRLKAETGSWAGAFQEAGERINYVWDAIKAKAQQIWTVIKFTALEAFAGIAETILTMPATIAVGLGQISDQFLALVEDVKAFFAGMAADVVASITGIPDKIKGAMASMWETIWEGSQPQMIDPEIAVDLTESGRAAALSFSEGLLDGSADFEAAAAEIEGYLNTIGNADLSDEGRNIVAGLLRGMRSKFAELQATALELANSLKTTLQGALKIQSPSKVTEEIGEYAGQGFVVGLQNTADDLKKVAINYSAEAVAAMRAATAPIAATAATVDVVADASAAARDQAAALGATLAKTGDTGATAGRDVAASFDDAAKSAEEATGFADGLSGALENTAKTAGEVGNQIGSALKSGIGSISGELGKLLTFQFNSLDDFFSSILKSLQRTVAGIASTLIENSLTKTLFGGGNARGGITGGLGGLGGGLFSGIGQSFKSLGSLFSGGVGALGGFGSALGAIVPAVGVIGLAVSAFISKTRELDSGVRLTISGMDALVETFRTVEKTRFFGLSRKVRTSYGQASAEVADPVTDAVAEIQAGIVDMAATLGIGADAFADFSHQFQVSLDGLSNDEAIAAITAELEGLGNSFASLAVPAEFIRAGEEAGAALERLATALPTVNAVMGDLGFKLFDVSLAGADAASRMAEVFGSLDEFVNASQFYLSNFYSAAEQFDIQTRNLTAAFGELGLKLPETRDQFRQIVDAFAGIGDTQTVAQLMQLAPAFDDFIATMNSGLEQQLSTARQTVDAAEQAAREAYDAAIRAVEAERDALVDEWQAMIDDVVEATRAATDAAELALDQVNIVIDAQKDALRAAFDEVSDGLDDLIDTASDRARDAERIADLLRRGVDQTTTQSLDQAMAVLGRDLADLTFDEISRAVDTASTIGASGFATSVEFARAQARAAAAIRDLSEEAEAQLTIEERNLAALEDLLIAVEDQYQADIDALDAQAQWASDQLDALLNIDRTLQGAVTAIYGANASTRDVVQGAVLGGNRTLQGAVTAIYGANASTRNVVQDAVLDGNQISEFMRGHLGGLADAQQEERITRDAASAQISTAEQAAARQIAALNASVSGILRLDNSISNVTHAVAALDRAINDLKAAQLTLVSAEASYAEAQLREARTQSALTGELIELMRQRDVTSQIDAMQARLASAVNEFGGSAPGVASIVERRRVGTGASYVVLSDGARFESFEGNSSQELANATAQANAYIASQRSNLTGYTNTVERLRAQIRDLGGIPSFNSGGIMGRRGLAHIGESDLELVSPSRIYNGAETAAMLDNRQVVREIALMRGDMQSLLVSGNENTARIVRLEEQRERRERFAS